MYLEVTKKSKMHNHMEYVFDCLAHIVTESHILCLRSLYLNIQNLTANNMNTNLPNSFLLNHAEFNIQV